MIKFENAQVFGFEAAVRGARNARSSWDKSDSYSYSAAPLSFNDVKLPEGFVLGDKDRELLIKLSTNKPSEAKYRRMIQLYMDVTAPLYWWKDYDTYKIGTVANSCSSIERIKNKEFDIGDFSIDTLSEKDIFHLQLTIDHLNILRNDMLENSAMNMYIYRSILALIPQCWNQRRTIMLNYQTLANLYSDREMHPVLEFRTLTDFICKLPYHELIVCTANKNKLDAIGLAESVHSTNCDNKINNRVYIPKENRD